MISERCETCWMSIPSRCITPKVMSERHRDRQRHQRRRPPFPEADQRDEHDEDDGLVEASHEQLDVLADLHAADRTCAR